MSHKRTTQRGFTLAEVLVGIAVFALIFVAALLLYDRANKIFKSSMESSDVQQNTRVAFERLMAELRMAGFDFDRDGYPQGSQKYQQPDEQLEFVHPRAITFRANLDYESDSATDNGRETAYEPGYTTTAATTDDYFPIVTTGNDEIVTYFLRSETNSANDDSISFYADVARPRRTFPVSGTGQDETQVTISNVDLCQNSSGVDTGCLNPPYTLYRVTLQDNGTVGTPVPVATNVRSMKITYYKDTAATVAATPNGGAGRILVTSTTPAADLAAREVRATIRGLHVELVGMSESADKNYVEPIETALPSTQQVATAKTYRQYKLESTLVPRNLGKRGLQELDVRPPGAPLLTSVCTVGCGVVRVNWNAPTTGSVTAYSVVYGTTANPNSIPIDAGRNTYAYVPGLTPGTPYYFMVAAENPHGTNFSNVFGPVTPINRTAPEAPTNGVATGTSVAGGPAAIVNRVRLNWLGPQTNVTFGGQPPMNSCGQSEGTIQAQAENSGYTIKRSDSATFDPATSGQVLFNGAMSAAGAPTADTSGNTTYTDTTPRVNCRPYYYAVRVFENGCSTVPANNSSGDVAQAISGWSTVFEGQSTATVAPAVPVNPVIGTGSTCATDPCTVVVNWPEVTQDANGVPIQVANYVVRRRTYVGGILNAASEVTFNVTDVPGNGTATYTDNPPAPPTGTIYHYAIAAKQCSTLTSTYSVTEARYPCVALTITAGGSTIVDGSGTASNPWLIGGNTAQINVTANTNLTAATATVREMPSGTAVSLGNGLTSATTATWSYPMPGSGSLFEFTMTVTDVNGCTTSERRYAQEAPAACCLRPYKDASGSLFDASIVALQNPAPNSGPMTITIKLKNDCDDILTIDSMRMAWTGFGTGGSNNNLESAAFPATAGGTVTETYGPDQDGAHSFTMSSITGASNTIAAGGSYNVVLTMTRAQSTDLNTVSSFCVRYTRNGVTFEDCRIVQNAGASCP